MSEKIKILMLGDSSSGKTCFMLGMYAAIQNGSKFSLKATDPDEGVEMATLWSTIVGESGEERWPRGTDTPQIYNFELCYAYKSLIEFEWLDYRGGSMLDISSDDNVRTLRNYAAESNGLFFCISGKDLREPVTEANLQNIAIKSKANLMGQYLQYLNINRRPARKKSFPIIIMVTKYDYCYHRNKRELMEDVKKMFPPLFAPNSDWLVMICPVTLGKELAKNSDNGKIEPRNLDIPVAFVLYCILTEQARIQDEKFTEIDDQLEVLESNLFNRWINRRKIKRLNESLRQAEMQFKKTIEMINVLAREQDLSSTDIYLSGKKIQIDLDLS
jgi:GTPase SAR1 family protein